MKLDKWKQVLLFSGLAIVISALWLWGDSPNSVYACDPSNGDLIDCDFDLPDSPNLFIEKVGVYYQAGDEICYFETWVLVLDMPKLMASRDGKFRINASPGTVGIFTEDTFTDLLNDGTIAEISSTNPFGGRTQVECTKLESNSDDVPPDFPTYGTPEPYDPIDPPIWVEFTLEEPIQDTSHVYGYGHKMGNGFYTLFYVLPLEE